MSVDELIEKSWDQRARGRFEEAVISARAATVQEPSNANSWWQLALNNYSLGRVEAALEAIKITLEHAPYFAQGWAQRGTWELTLGYELEAEKSFEMALECDTNQVDALSGMANILSKRDTNDSASHSQEIQILTRLDELGFLTIRQVSRLGVLHFRNKHGFEAIKYWHRNASGISDVASLYNLGLAYNMGDVSQDIDAMDCWRLVMQWDESYDKASFQIQRLEPRLLELAKKIRSTRQTLALPESQWYSLYINPFQLLNCPKEFDFDQLEPKIIQKWKKNLLQEIELEEGDINWMPGLIINRSKAIEISEKLSDENLASFHWAVYQCNPLLEFLSKGDFGLFLLDPEWSPLDIIEMIWKSDQFLEWLSEPFSIQYDKIFTKAISTLDVPAIEALLDGRRWVLPSYADRCFENALHKASSILDPLKYLADRAKNVKCSTAQIELMLRNNEIITILNLLPPYFRNLQNEAVSILRNIAIDANNVHDDSELSLSILELCKKFSFKSIELTQRIEEDLKVVSENIRKQREHESSLRFKNDMIYKITKEGISQNDVICPPDEIIALRWGIKVLENGSQNYLFSAKNRDGNEYSATWTSSNTESQGALFDSLIRAALHYIVPNLIENLLGEIKYGKSIHIDSLEVSEYGVYFTSKGFIFTTKIKCPWSEIDFIYENGSVIVVDKVTKKKSFPISLRDVPNAIMLRFLQMSFNQY